MDVTVEVVTEATRRRRRRGGARPGAGRKRKARLERVKHTQRPSFTKEVGHHVTLRVREDVRTLRGSRRFRVIWRALCKGCNRFGMRVVQFSVQKNHLHLVVEAADRRALTRGMQGLAIRIAKGLNKSDGRRGKVFADRYHAKIIRTSRQARNVYRYVLNNWRKHAPGLAPTGCADPCSSACYFDGWNPGMVVVPVSAPTERGPPVAAAETWLLTKAWRRHGLLSFDDAPASSDERQVSETGPARQRP